MPAGTRRHPQSLTTALTTAGALNGNAKLSLNVCYEDFDALVDAVSAGNVSLDSVYADAAAAMLEHLPTAVVRQAAGSKRTRVADTARSILGRNTPECGTEAALTADIVDKHGKNAIRLVRALKRRGATLDLHAAEAFVKLTRTRQIHNQWQELAEFVAVGNVTRDAAEHIMSNCGRDGRLAMFGTGMFSVDDMRTYAAGMTIEETIDWFADCTDGPFVRAQIERCHTLYKNNTAGHRQTHRLPESWRAHCRGTDTAAAAIALCSEFLTIRMLRDGDTFFADSELRHNTLKQLISNPEQFWKHRGGDHFELATFTNTIQLDVAADAISILNRPAVELLGNMYWEHGIAHKLLQSGLNAEQSCIALSLMSDGTISVDDAIWVAANMN